MSRGVLTRLTVFAEHLVEAKLSVFSDVSPVRAGDFVGTGRGKRHASRTDQVHEALVGSLEVHTVHDDGAQGLCGVVPPVADLASQERLQIEEQRLEVLVGAGVAEPAALVAPLRVRGNRLILDRDPEPAVDSDGPHVSWGRDNLRDVDVDRVVAADGQIAFDLGCVHGPRRCWTGV